MRGLLFGMLLLVVAIHGGCLRTTETTEAVLEREVAAWTTSLRSIYFGDIHAHSAYSNDGCTQDGVRNPGSEANLDSFLTYAKQTAQLDFVAVSDHAEGLNDAALATMVDKTKAYADDSFVPFVGYEWTSRTFGHRTVIFKQLSTDNMPLFSTRDTSHVRSLWNKFMQSGLAGQVFSLPHHPAGGPAPVDWNHHNQLFEPLVEVYSEHGSSEDCGAFELIGSCDATCTVQAALQRGYQAGIYAGTDSHDSRPGSVDDQDTCEQRQHSYFGGLIAVLADQLSREAIWTAMRQRRVYGTSGPRIELRFLANGRPMGSIITAASGDNVRLVVVARAESGAITNIEILGSQGVEHSCSDAEVCVHDVTAGEQTQFFYVRVTQVDGEREDRAWSSPIWISQ